MTRYPIDEILALVQGARNADAGWPRLRALCEQHWPSPLWAELRGVDSSHDAQAAADWLHGQIGVASAAGVALRGVYLGLDTLNMDGPGGSNVEIGGTASLEAGSSGEEIEVIDWVHRLEWYGDHHLIAGLRAMKEIYEQDHWEAEFDAADYVLFLGYSGIVLADAAAKIRWPESVVLVWGFHDGDLFRLGRGNATGFEHLVARSEYSPEYLEASREKARLVLEDFKRQHPHLFRRAP